MKTPEEIKKGLECCAEYGNCSQGCPYNPIKDCGHDLYSDALTLIKQLEGGIDRYCGMGMRLERERDELFKMTKQLEHERNALLDVIRGDCAICANYKECIEGVFTIERNYPSCWQWRGVREVE